MSVKLIRELSEDVEFLTEGEGKDKAYYVSGIVMQGNLKNGNGRTYPMETLRSAVDKYVTEYVNRKRALGELGHPASPSFNYDRASHKFVELKEDGNNIIGKAKIMTNLPMGQIVKGLMDEDCLLGISSRSVGSVREERGIKTVQGDFSLITAGDIVHTPSAPNAFLENIREESEWVMSAGGEWIQEFMDRRVKPTLENSVRKSVSREEREASFASLFEEFLGKIQNS